MNSDQSDFKPLRSPIRWYGSKARLAKTLIRLLPVHDRYVEVCCGSAAMLLAKEPCGHEVLNDLNADLMAFWRRVKDPATVSQLVARLQVTSIEHDEYDLCDQLYDLCIDPLERARMFMVLSRLSINGCFRVGWSDTTPHEYRRSFPNAVARLEAVSRRLQGVTLENLDFRLVIPKYDSPDACLYVDPPYISDTRKTPERYKHEMTDVDHEELARMLVTVKSSVVLSGYAHPIYDDHLTGWIRVPIRTINHAAQGSGMAEKPSAIEVVWIKPAAGLSHALLTEWG